MEQTTSTSYPNSFFQKHHYGPRVFLLNDSFHHTLLGRLCQNDCLQPMINQGIRPLYERLLETAVNLFFHKQSRQRSTRMAAFHPSNPLSQAEITPEQKAVVVDLARAGIWPSQICYESLHWILNPSHIRQDHIFASRLADESHRVVDTQLSSYKIGGSIDDSFVLLPDPMGATGTTMVAAINFYKKQIEGQAKQYLALHLIVTPEYLKKVLDAHPDLTVIAFRLDRGLSSPEVLRSELGVFWDQEKGLNSNDYIVPGAGGFGEIMNNSFV